MKFNDGYWNRKKGIQFYTPAEIVDVESCEGKITVTSSHKIVPHRGETTNAKLITTELFSPAPNVIGIRHTHWIGVNKTGPEFKLNETCVEPKIEINDQYARLQSEDTWVEVTNENGWTMKFYHKGRFLTGTTRKDMGYVVDINECTYMKEQLNVGAGEYIYGFGERFTNFVKNGQQIELWNLDGGTASEQAYKNIPFYVSSQRYGVFINHPERISVEVASEVMTGVGFSVQGETLEYYIFGADTLKDVIIGYTGLTGRPAVPPPWSYGLWLSTSFTTEYDSQKVLEFAKGMRDRKIPLSVMHLDCFYQNAYCFCDFRWDQHRFPNPKELADDLISQDLRLSIWINPYIGQKSPVFKECADKGYFIKKKDGSIWQTDLWMAGNAILDFTNPAAREWYTAKLIEKMDTGVSVFKTDFGETIPTDDVVFYDGSDPQKMHNYYTYLYNNTVFEAVERYYGNGNGLVFGRSATVGSQMFPLQWAGDSYSSYGSMAETLRGGLSLSLAGFGFWSHDMSGFEKTATPDLYKRWCAFGLLSTHSRLHGSESYRIPWLFGDESVDVLRAFTKLKCRLMPYIFSKSCEASQTGIPVMRPMILEFDRDFVCRMLDMQYMFGDALLVAPIFNEYGSVEYYLPEGNWTNIITEEVLNGGKTHKGVFDYFSLPLMAREDCIIPMGSCDDTTDYDYEEGVELNVYSLKSTADCLVYGRDRFQKLSLHMERKNDIIDISILSVQKPYSLVFHSVNSFEAFDRIYSAESGVVRIRMNPGITRYQIKELR